MFTSAAGQVIYISDDEESPETSAVEKPQVDFPSASANRTHVLIMTPETGRKSSNSPKRTKFKPTEIRSACGNQSRLWQALL